jgi:uncharacterized protein YabN with tetrapyrrole methylase and pyrophosphatase domain
MEETCQKRGISLDELSLEEQDKLWEEAKEETGGGEQGEI